VERGAGGIVFDFGEWKSAVASRKNDDGTISFITVDPTIDGFEFVVGAPRVSGFWSSATDSMSTSLRKGLKRWSPTDDSFSRMVLPKE